MPADDVLFWFKVKSEHGLYLTSYTCKLSYTIVPLLHASLNSFNSYFTQDEQIMFVRFLASSIHLSSFRRLQVGLVCYALSSCNWYPPPPPSLTNGFLPRCLPGLLVHWLRMRMDSLWLWVWHEKCCNKYSLWEVCKSEGYSKATETPKQIGWWVAQQINDSINCQLPHKLSFMADIPFHFHLLSQNSFVWSTARLSPALVHLFFSTLTAFPVLHLSTLLILFFSSVSLCLSWRWDDSAAN